MICRCLLQIILICFITVQAEYEEPGNTTKKCVRPGKTYVYLYHPESGQWYVSKGDEASSDSDPCYEDQYWDERCDGSVVGYCECIPGFGMSVCNSTLENGRPVGKSTDGKCYPLYSRANCPIGSWLTLSSKGKPTCKINPCHGQYLFYNVFTNYLKVVQANHYLGRLDGRNDTVVVLPEGYLHGGMCYRTLTQGHCPYRNQTAIFSAHNSVPNCVEIFDKAGQIRQFQCGGGGGYLGYSESAVCPVNYYRHGSDCLQITTDSVEFAEE